MDEQDQSGSRWRRPPRREPRPGGMSVPALEWALYARISTDRRDGAGVAQQVEAELKRAAADRVIVPEARQYIDNDISASMYSRKRRPAYDALLGAARRGELAGVIVFKLDRLYRRPMELEEVIPTGLYIACTDDTDVDLSTPGGQMTARVIAAVGANEVSTLSVRIRARKAQDRADGRSHTAVAFGWDTAERVNVGEMALVHEAIDRVISGVSLGTIARDWNRRGIPTKHGARGWTSNTVSQSILNPRQAGLLAHRGEILDIEPNFRRLNAEHLVPLDVRRQLLQVVKDRHNGGGGSHGGRIRWLSGVFVCGRCGGKMTTVFGAGKSRSWRCFRRPGYINCGRVYSTALKLEAVVLEALFQYVDSIDLVTLAKGDRRDEATKVVNELDGIVRLRSVLYADAEAGLITDEERSDRLGKLRAREDGLRTRLERTRTTTGPLTAHAGRRGQLRRIWPELTIAEQHEVVVAAFGTIAIMPTSARGRAAFDASRVVISPRVE